MRYAVSPFRGRDMRVDTFPRTLSWAMMSVPFQGGDECGFIGIGAWLRILTVGIDELLKDKRDEILLIAARHGVTGIQIFGSVAQGEATAESDVDLLIEVGGPTTPWFPGCLVADLEALLGRRVDVVEADALNEAMRERVMGEAVPL